MSDLDKKAVEVGESLMPVLDVVLSGMAAVMPGMLPIAATYSALTIPWKYLIQTYTRMELERMNFLIHQLAAEVKSLESGKAIEGFFKSEAGEYLLKRGVEVATQKGGEKRIDLIAKILASASTGFQSNYTAEDFLNGFDYLSEKEIELLIAAYELFENKDQIGAVRTNQLQSLPALSIWKQLHDRFPKIEPQEFVPLFIRMQMSGFVVREQGVMGDNGDYFSLTSVFLKFVEYIHANRS